MPGCVVCEAVCVCVHACVSMCACLCGGKDILITSIIYRKQIDVAWISSDCTQWAITNPQNIILIIWLRPGDAIWIHVFRVNYVNSTPADALATLVTTSPRTMVLNMRDDNTLFPQMISTTCAILMLNKANLRDSIAATGLEILLKLDSNRRFFRLCDLEMWWMTSENNRAPLLLYIKLCASFQIHRWTQN